MDRHASEIWQGSHTVEIPLTLLAHLSKIQSCLGVRGTIGEIGVHGGLFFIGLAHLAFEGESLWACDVFEMQQHKNVDGSGFGNKPYFAKQCKRFGITEEDVRVYVGSSAELDIAFTSKESLPPFRLISVDGGHTRQLTFNDLTIAASNLAKVIDGMLSWLALYLGDFGPFFVGHNKVLLAHADFHSLYYHAILEHPYWHGQVSDNPATNKNIHKSKESGMNHHSWGNYKYLALREDGGNNITTLWYSEHNLIVG